MATKMSGMIDEVLDTTRLQLGRPLPLSYESVNLVALANRVAAECQKSTDIHRIRMEAAARRSSAFGMGTAWSECCRT